jgi:hypothetical protein
VLAFLATLCGRLPETDDDLLSLLRTRLPPHACYAGTPTAIPIAWDRALLTIASNVLSGACLSSSVGVLAIRCVVIGEPDFNALVREAGGKSATTLAAIRVHLASLMDLAQFHPGDSVRLVCDRLGGREAYSDVLHHVGQGLNLTGVRIIEESPTLSRYVATIQGREIGVVFLTESERAHLPVALASMTAKYVRELAMARFNRYWCALHPDLKPTAGYWQDAKRWLKAVGETCTAADRRQLIRIA